VQGIADAKAAQASGPVQQQGGNMQTLFGARARFIALAIASSCVAQAAVAQDSPWRLRVGPGVVKFDESVAFQAGGVPAPGATASLSSSTTLMAEIGYVLSPEWSLGLAIGIPPTTKIQGTGTIAAFGELGRVKYAPAALTAQYQFQSLGAFKPYVGAGAVYQIIVSETDGAIGNLKVKNSWGSVLQLGAEYELGPRHAVFVDFKKTNLKTTATGTLTAAGGVPISADARLNPMAVMVGMSFRF
jgi:outer membrane protein